MNRNSLNHINTIWIVLAAMCLTGLSTAQTSGNSFYIPLPDRDDSNYNYIEDVFEFEDNEPFGDDLPGKPYYYLSIIGIQESTEVVQSIDGYVEFKVEYPEPDGGIVWKPIYDDKNIPDGATDDGEWMKVAIGSSRTVGVPPTMPTSDPNNPYSLRVNTVSTGVAVDQGYGSIRVVTRYSGDEISVSLAAMTAHAQFARRATPNYCYGDGEEVYHDNLVTIFATGLPDIDITHILPVSSLGTKYIVSPPIPGRRAAGSFAVCLVGTEKDVPTQVNIGRPPGMPDPEWIEILNANDVSITPLPDSYSVLLKEGEVYVLSDNQDKNIEDGGITTRFQGVTKSTAYGGLRIDSGASPIAVLTVEHNAKTEYGRSSSNRDVFISNPSHDFTIDQAIPREADGTRYCIPICPPFAATGHNVRIMAFEDNTQVSIYRTDYGQPTENTPTITWTSSYPDDMVLDLETNSIQYLGQTPPTVTPSAHPLGTDEVLFIKSEQKPISIVIAPRTDAGQGMGTNDPDFYNEEGNGVLPVSADASALGAYAMSVPPINQYTTSCTWAIPNLYETNILSSGAISLPWDPELLAQPGVYMRNYVVVVARDDIYADTCITYNNYVGTSYEIEEFTTLIDDIPIDTTLLNNEGVTEWESKGLTATNRLTEWESYPGSAGYKWCLLQLSMVTEPMDLAAGCTQADARRVPQSGIYKVFVDNDTVSNLPQGDKELVAAYAIGLRLPSGFESSTEDYTHHEPTAYGFATVPIRLPTLASEVEDELLAEDFDTLDNLTMIGSYEPSGTAAKWTLSPMETPQTPGAEVPLRYSMLLRGLSPSSLRQMSVETRLHMPDILLMRTRGPDYLPVLADPWGLTIFTDSDNYPRDVTAVATSTIHPTPISKREVFDVQSDFITPSAHILDNVIVDGTTQPDTDTATPLDIAVLARDGSTYFTSGELAIVADAGHPVRWKEIKLVLADPIAVDGNSIAQSTAMTSVDIGVRAAPTLAALSQLRQDPNSLKTVQATVTASGDYLIDETTAYDLPVSQFLEVSLTLHAGSSSDYSPAIESIYVAHHPASLSLSMQVEEPPAVAGQQGDFVASLGSFPLSGADLALNEVVRTAEFDTGSVPAGAYVARVFVHDGLSGEVLAKASTDFVINTDTPPTALGAVSVTPSILDTDDHGTIASKVDNPNDYTVFENVSVDVTASKDGGTTNPVSYSYTIERLDPKIEHVEPIDFIAESTFAEGDYVVTQVINIGTPTLGPITNTTTFNVRSSTSRLAGLSGTLLIGNSTVDLTGDPDVSFMIRNSGNEDLTNVKYRFVFPYPTGSPDDGDNADPFVLELTGPTDFDIGQTDTVQLPRSSYFSPDTDPTNGLIPNLGRAYPIQLSATSDEHFDVADALNLSEWVPIDAGAFVVFSDPLQVSPRRYIPIVLEPSGDALASTGIGLNVHGDVVGTSSGDPGLNADETATAWSLSRDPLDLHNEALSGLGLSGTAAVSSTALNINRDGYLVGQVTSSEWARSFIADAFGSYFSELLPSTTNSNIADAFVTDISDESTPTAVGYEILALETGGSASGLAMGDPGLIGSEAGSGEVMSGSLEPGEEVTTSSTSSGGTSLLGPGGAPGTATTLVPSAIYWPNAHNNPGLASLADLSGLGDQAGSTVEGSRYWGINASGDVAGDWYNDVLEMSGFRSYNDSLIDVGQYLDRDTTLRGIGNDGRTVGWSGEGIDQKTFQVKISGNQGDLVPSPSGASDQYAYAINGNGEAVGSSGVDPDQAVAAWDNSLFHDPYVSFTAAPRTPWKLLEMRDVNDSGQMIGTAEIPQVLLGKGIDVVVASQDIVIPIPEALDVGSFFADAEGSGHEELEALSDPQQDNYFGFTNTDEMEGPIGINQYFGGVPLSEESEYLRAAEIFDEVFYAPDGVNGITVTPVIDQGFGLRMIGVIRLSQVEADPALNPIRWAVEAIQNSVVLVQQYDDQLPGYWSLWADPGEAPVTGDVDYRQPFYIDFSNQTYSWMATEPFAFFMLPNVLIGGVQNGTAEPGKFLAEAGAVPDLYETNLRAAGWYPGPELPLDDGGETGRRPPLFSISSANPESKEHMLSYQGSWDTGQGIETLTLLQFEGTSRNSENGNNKGSNRDFNDHILVVEPALETRQPTRERAVLLDPVRFDITLLERIRLWARSDVGVIPALEEYALGTGRISRWWDFGTWQHHFGVEGDPAKDASDGAQAHPGIRLDGGLAGVGDTGDALVAYDIRYSDDNKTVPDLGDFVGDATFLMVVDLEQDTTDVSLFSTNKQVVRSASIEANADRARIGLYLNSAGKLQFESKTKHRTSPVYSSVQVNEPVSSASGNRIIGIRITHQDAETDWQLVELILDDQTVTVAGNLSEAQGLSLSGSVRPIWTDIAIGRDIQDNYGAFVIREAMMFDRALTDEELLDVTDYLTERYSITP